MQVYVCQSCGQIITPDQDVRRLPLYQDCEGQCVITVALVCQDRPPEAEDDVEEEAPDLAASLFGAARR